MIDEPFEDDPGRDAWLSRFADVVLGLIVFLFWAFMFFIAIAQASFLLDRGLFDSEPLDGGEGR